MCHELRTAGDETEPTQEVVPVGLSTDLELEQPKDLDLISIKSPQVG